MKKSAFYLKLLGVLLIIFSFSACNNKADKEVKEEKKTPPESTFSLTEAKKEIVEANDKFSELFAAKDSAGVANLYTEDAKFMMNGSPAIKGREEIKAVMSGFINADFTRVDLKTIDVWGTEDLLAEEGELKLYKGDTEVDKGKYIVLWKKVDGEWHLFRDIFNTDLTPE